MQNRQLIFMCKTILRNSYPHKQNQWLTYHFCIRKILERKGNKSKVKK